MKRCALVVRVSTDRQASNPEGSLKTQMEALREFLRYKQTVGEETWVESGCYELKAISGKDSYRSKEFAQLFAAIRAGQVNVVVCTALDRICRSVRDFLNFFEILNEHGVEFVCLKQNYDTTSPQGRLFITMMMALAQFEREQTAERTRDSVRARAGRGLWNGGQLLGYDLDPSKKGTLIPNEAEVAVVRFAFDAYLRTGSILETVKEMNARGYRTKAYESRRGKHHPAKEFTYNVVRWLLRNHAYIGMKELNKTRGNGELQERDAPELVEAVWPGIIDRDVFDAVQEQMAANARANGNRAKSVRHTYLFNGGLLWCAECETQMEGRSGTGSKGRKYYYYVCRDRFCRLKVRADELEQTVLDRLGELAEEPDILDGVVATTNEELRKRTPDLAKERASLARELEGVQGQAAGLLDQLVELNGSEAGRFARERLEELGERRQQIEAAIVDVENSLERAERSLVSADHVRAALANVREVFAGLNPKQQKDVVRLIVARIEAGPGQISLALHGHPPDLARPSGETAGAARFPPLNWLPDRVTGRTARSRVTIERDCRQRGRGKAAELVRVAGIEDPIEKTIRNPIRRADEYAAFLRDHPGSTYRDAAQEFGVTAATVCHHVALVRRLPDDFVEWLREIEDATCLQFFTERRLRPITKAARANREALCADLQARSG